MASLKKRSSECNLLQRKPSYNSKRKGKAELKRGQSVTGSLGTRSAINDEDKSEQVEKVEIEVLNLRNTLTSLDAKIGGLMRQIDARMPAYNQARAALGSSPVLDQKKNLIFYGVELDSVRLELIKDPSYTQDILEARLRSVMFEQLNITRDIPMDKVNNMHRLKTKQDEFRNNTNHTKSVQFCKAEERFSLSQASLFSLLPFSGSGVS
jgi:hypothetical protein